MILFEEALKIIENIPAVNQTEKVDIFSAFNRILAEDVFSDVNMPPFNKSAVDGYACRQQDTANELTVIETIQAGQVPEKNIGPNQCSKIMTGAMVPPGADFILMVEHTTTTGENKIKVAVPDNRANICHLGEDVKHGDLVLKKGTIIRTGEMAVLASAGYANPLVSKKINVAVLTTGNELVEPHIKPKQAQIRNSNGYQLVAQIQQAGAIANYFGIVEDTEDETARQIEEATKHNDVIVLTGGVSMGDYDFVPMVLKKLGFTIHFHSIAVQPGKPAIFASRGNTYCFGLPGNPVSSFVQFEFLIKPLLCSLSGGIFKPRFVKAILAKDISRKRTDRKMFLPVNFDAGNYVNTIEYHGSAHINAITNATGFIWFEIGEEIKRKGDLVHVRLL